MTPVKRYKLDTDVGYNGGPFVIPAGQVMIREADYKDLEHHVADLTANLAMLKRHVGMDCGDNSCLFALKITGMRTNGGCRCNPKRMQRDLDELRAQRDDLTAQLAAGRQWTNEQPRTPGWYWWKGRPDVCPDVHYVSEQDIAEGNPPGLWCGPLEAPR